MEEPACSRCGDFGFLRRDLPLDHPEFGRLIPCDCTQRESQETRSERLQRYSSLGPLTNKTFSTLAERGRSQNPQDQAAFSVLVADSKAFAARPAGWLVIYGPSGAGKTHVAAAIANRCIELGKPALFVVVPDLLDNLRASYFADDTEDDPGYHRLLEQVRTAPVLVLDDLGTQAATPWAQEKLFQILNHRYNAEMPTVVTTNLSVDRLEERMRMRLTDPNITTVYFVEASKRAVDPDLPDSFNLERIREWTFEAFDTRVPHLSQDDRLSLQMAYSSALRFADEPDGWLLFVGTNGSGKTHLAAAITNRLRARGERPIFFVVADLLDYLRNAMDKQGAPGFQEIFAQVRNAKVLILDDFGGQSDPSWVRDRLFQLINHRYTARLATVFTVSTDALERMEERVAARLNDPGVCTEVPITAPAYRVDLRDRPAALSRAPQTASRREPVRRRQPGR